MARVPYRQGGLDSLCGVYSVVNAVAVAVAPIKRLTEKDHRDLFAFLICALKLEDGLPLLLISGCHYPVLSRLLKFARCWLWDRHCLQLHYRRPFHRRLQNRTADALRTLEHHLNRDRRVAIIRITGVNDHWTVVRSVGKRTRTLHLCDSGGGRYLNRQSLLARRRTRLVVRDTILITIIEPSARPVGSRFRFAATRQRSRKRLVRPGRREQVPNVDLEGVRQPLQDRDRRVLELPLEPADIGAVDPGIDRQVLLGDVPPNPNLAKVSRNQRLRPHRRRPSP